MPPPASCTTLLLELAGETMSSPRDSAQAWKRDRSAADLTGAEAPRLEPSHRFLNLVQLAPLTAVEGCHKIGHNSSRRVCAERSRLPIPPAPHLTAGAQHGVEQLSPRIPKALAKFDQRVGFE